MGNGGAIGRRLRPRVLAWSLPALSAVLVAAAVTLAFLAPAWRPDVEVGPSFMLVVVPLVFPIVGALIASRDPTNPIGWLFCAVGVTGGALIAVAVVAVVEPPLPARDWAAWASEWLYAATLGVLGLALLYFPDGRLPSRRWRIVVWLLALALGLLVAGVTFGPELPTLPGIANPLGIDPPGGPQLYEAAFAVGWALTWATVVAAVASLLVRFVNARGEERQQLKWLTYAACLLVILAVASFIAFVIDRREFTVVAGVGVLAIPVAVGIAILRHRLYDIDLLINRTVIYGVLTVTLGLGYAAIVLLLGGLFGGSSSLTASAATLLVAAAFQPVRRRVQDGVDRRFNRHKYDAAKTIEAASARLRGQVNLDALTAELLTVVDQTMQPTAVSLWLHPLEAETPAMDIAADDPLLARVREIGRGVEAESLQLDSAALRELRVAGVELVVPLISQRELIGLLNLGPRRGERAYAADDRKLLSDLAGHAAPALRLAQLVRRQHEEVRERERIDNELRVAQLIQQKFLPHEPPDLPGWQVAALYRPARAVGGDFYDFIPLPDGQVGIVIGDVTDKGVPAALVMATTHAILRAEAPRLAAPARVLERANDLLVNETFEHMFVTCLYAVLDPASGHLCFANAGQSLPYLHGEAGVVELRATGMPLGMLPDRHYEETSLTVAPGDDLLLYSDGLTEAHGPGREMFGVPRLAELVAGGAGGEGLIDVLLGELAAFTGPDWEQEDDITLVTLQRIGTASAGAAVPAGAGQAADAGHVLARFDVPSAAGNERLAIDGVVAAVRPLGLSPATLERLKTAVAEATMNAIEHGNAGHPDLPVTVRVVTAGGDLRVQVTDQGGGRPIAEPAPPDLEAKLAGEQSPRGWGLFLIKHMVDELRTTGDERHNTIELIMHLDEASAGGG
ncbi:MAG: ATP-binding SpoIIE family protein phosphatase [Acidimicrobiales bacterium]